MTVHDRTTSGPSRRCSRDCAPVVADGHWARATTFESDAAAHQARLRLRAAEDTPTRFARPSRPASGSEGPTRLRACSRSAPPPRCSVSRRSAPASHLKRPALLGSARRYVIVVLLAAIGAFVVMETALFAHDFSIAYVADNVARATPGPLHVHGRVERARGIDPAVGARCSRSTSRSPRGGSATAPTIRSSRGRRSCSSCVLAVLLRADAVPGQPVQGGDRRDPARRRRPEPAAAEPPARRDPPADPLRGLRRLHDPVLVRDRGARHRPLR